MSSAARLYLLVAAALCATFVGIAGAGFALMAEPQRTDAWTFAFWVLASLLVASPMWVPALVPDRHSFALRLARWLGALALLVPTWWFAKMVVEQLRMSSAPARLMALDAPFLMGLGVLTACTVALVVLVLPDVRRAPTISRDVDRC